MLDTSGILGSPLWYFSAFQWRNYSPPMFPGDTVCASELCATRLAWYLSHSTHQFSCSYKQQTYADRGYHPPWVHHRCNPQIYYHFPWWHETNRYTYWGIHPIHHTTVPVSLWIDRDFIFSQIHISKGCLQQLFPMWGQFFRAIPCLIPVLTISLPLLLK